MAFTHALSTNNYGPAKFIVTATAANGTHTTIASALSDATSGDTIFIRPGTYTENLTLVAGVNLTAFGSDSSLNGTGKVIISGTCTLTTAGSVTISGIQLQTNSAALLAVTGSAASIVNLQNCYLNMTNNTGITFSSSNAAAKITISNCFGDLGTTGIGIYTNTSAGTLTISQSIITNSGLSLSASTTSAGSVQFYFSNFSSVFSTSSGGAMSMFECVIDTSTINTTILTTAGTGTQTISHCYLASGTASTLSAGSGTTIGCFLSNINSGNTNALTGAGTINTQGNVFSGTSQTNNATTQTQAGILKGSTTTAPTAGMIGEQITANATSVATTSAASKTITSINLTAGVWDISGSASSLPTGGTTLQQNMFCGISTTNNTLPATAGVNYGSLAISATGMNAMSVSAPLQRVVITATTTYYLVVQNIYTSTTCPTNALISGTRVG